jgi:hypothetical protein
MDQIEIEDRYQDVEVHNGPSATWYVVFTSAGGMPADPLVCPPARVAVPAAPRRRSVGGSLPSGLVLGRYARSLVIGLLTGTRTPISLAAYGYRLCLVAFRQHAASRC